jgi:hypothetical protein
MDRQSRMTAVVNQIFVFLAQLHHDVTRKTQKGANTSYHTIPYSSITVAVTGEVDTACAMYARCPPSPWDLGSLGGERELRVPFG